MLIWSDAGSVSANRLLGDYIGVFLLAFAATFLISPLLRWIAVRNGIVDQPDQSRKSHMEPVAYLGGGALYLGWLGGVLLSNFLDPSYQVDGVAKPPVSDGFPLSIIFGATVVMLTGLIDDVYSISPRVKIGGQFVAAAALAWSSQNLGTKLVEDTLAVVGFETVPFPIAYVLGGMLIAAFVVGGCNAMNLIDGLDGLAAGVSAIVCVGLLFIAVNMGENLPDPGISRVPIVICLAMLGAVLGFVPYNFNPANIFMGDAGSLLLGYLSVSTILLFADAPRRGPVLVAAALIVYALPITDMFLTIWRRALTRQPLSKADQGHLHHRVLAVVGHFIPSPNLCVKLAVLAMYGLAAAFTVVGCSLVFVGWQYVVAVFLAIFCFIVVGSYKSSRRAAYLDKLRESENDGSSEIEQDDSRQAVATGSESS